MGLCHLYCLPTPAMFATSIHFATFAILLFTTSSWFHFCCYPISRVYYFVVFYSLVGFVTFTVPLLSLVFTHSTTFATFTTFAIVATAADFATSAILPFCCFSMFCHFYYFVYLRLLLLLVTFVMFYRSVSFAYPHYLLFATFAPLPCATSAAFRYLHWLCYFYRFQYLFVCYFLLFPLGLILLHSASFYWFYYFYCFRYFCIVGYLCWFLSFSLLLVLPPLLLSISFTTFAAFVTYT